MYRNIWLQPREWNKEIIAEMERLLQKVFNTSFSSPWSFPVIIIFRKRSYIQFLCLLSESKQIDSCI